MLYFGGRNFWKAFRIVGLEARKSRRGVEQDLYGNFRANFKFFFFFLPFPPASSESFSFLYGVKDLFPLLK